MGATQKNYEPLLTLQEHIVHLHLHDNMGQWTDKYDGDEHMAPGKGCNDFSVLNLLSGYKGVYNLEVFSVDDICSGKETILKSHKSENLSP